MISVNGKVINKKFFPDGTQNIKCDLTDTDSTFFEIHWKYENDAELFTLICLKKFIDEFCPSNETYLYLPYLPNARMDRVKYSDEVFTLKYFCQVINDLHFHQVKVLDCHSDVGLALLDRVFEVKSTPYFTQAFVDTQSQVLFFPDEGAKKRYSENLSYFMKDKPIAFGIKNRDWRTGEIKGLTIDNAEAVKGKNVLIVDDICSRGGTFLHAAKALKEAGAENISLFVTHLERTVAQGELFSSGLLKAIYTTDSFFDAEAPLPCTKEKRTSIYVIPVTLF